MEANRIHRNHYISTKMNYSSPIPDYFDKAQSNMRQLHNYPDSSSDHSRNNSSYIHDSSKTHKVYNRDYETDVYTRSQNYSPPSDISEFKAPRNHENYVNRNSPSIASSIKTTQTSKRGELTLEAMSAPNPWCPNVRGMCCFMLLLNLAIILICIGFVIVIQFIQPLIVWICGIVFLIFGFVILIGSLVYLVTICREAERERVNYNDDLYWTHHWQKTFTTPEIHSKSNQKLDSYDQYSNCKY